MCASFYLFFMEAINTLKAARFEAFKGTFAKKALWLWLKIGSKREKGDFSIIFVSQTHLLKTFTSAILFISFLLC